MLRKVCAAVSAAMLLSLLATTPAAATTVINCKAGADLQAAIGAASPGDTLLIQGTCKGTFVIDKDLNLKGRGTRPTLDGQGSDTVLQVPWGPGGPMTLGPTVLVVGLTITGGSSQGVLNAGTLTLRDSVVRDNTGTGISVEIDLGATGGGLTLQHSTVRDNGGDGITNNSTQLTVVRSAVSYNGGIGILNGIQKQAIIRSSTVRGNGGTGIVNGGNILIEDVVVRDNRDGGIAGTSYITVRNTLITGNRRSGFEPNGGGLQLITAGAGDYITIETSVIKNNTASGSGGGIYIEGDGSTGVAGGSNLKLDRVKITNNIAGISGGGIYEAGPGTVLLIHSRVSRNQPDNCVGC